jgi:hypothetical protein
MFKLSNFSPILKQKAYSLNNKSLFYLYISLALFNNNSSLWILTLLVKLKSQKSFYAGSRVWVRLEWG